MSFEKSMPGKGIAKSAIKTVTANRNPNRQVVVGKTPEEESAEKKENDAELRAKFDETVAREFSTGKSSFQQFQQLQQQNQLAQLAAMNRSGGASGIPQMPQMPSGGSGGSGSTPKSNGGSTPKSGGSSGSTSKPQTHSLKKPDLIDEEKSQPKAQATKPTEAPKINPLSKPGQSQNSNEDSEQPRSQTSEKASFSAPKLAQGIADDANRISELRGFENPEHSQELSNRIASTYTQNQDKHSLGDAGVRRLVSHGIPFNEERFKPENSLEQNNEISNELISSKNINQMKIFHEGREMGKHYKQLGFSIGDYSQLTARQYKDSFKEIKQAKEDRNAFLEGPKTPDTIAKENSRSDKQALVLLPEKGAAEFDMSREMEDLKKLGFTPVFAQLDNENNLKTIGEDGTRTPIKKLADDMGGFGLVVLGGHGSNAKTPGIGLGNPTKEASLEKAYLDKTDFKDDSGIVSFFKDTSILKEGGTLASCSCSFTGSDEKRGADHIKPEESLAAIIGEVRPDADILGAFDEVYASNSKYTLDDEGKLQNPTMRRLDEPSITDELLAQVESTQELTKTDSALDNLDDMFADDYADDDSAADILDEILDDEVD